MRDIALTVVILGLLPFVLRRPHWGVLLWACIGIASPHRLTFGFANDLPWAAIVGTTTLIGILLCREPKRLPLAAPVVALLLFLGWTTVTSMFSLFPGDAWDAWQDLLKTQLFVLVTLLMMQTRERIKALVWVIALALGLYGVKGGLYTLAQGGGGMVIGPQNSYIEGNTEIALALTMTIPLMYWLKRNTEGRWIRRALVAGMLLTTIAILGSYSRGGLVAIAAMTAFFWLQSRSKFGVTVFLVLLVPALLAIMPGGWFDRMRTIQTYNKDESARGRIAAWNFAKDLAADRPMVGGGFRVFQPEAYFRWAKQRPTEMFDAHSIWFEVLGHHGYFGLGLFVLMWGLCWRTAIRIRRLTEGHTELCWAADLARLTLVSLVGYWVGGSFLGLAYWDLPYVLMALLVLTLTVVSKQVAATSTGGAALVGVPIAALRSRPQGQS
jgi:probable O-glycosylation ligase (exosortase A-associated)